MAVIKFPCFACSKAIAVEPEHAGRQVRCPHCQQVVEAPAGEPVENAGTENPFQFPETPAAIEAPTIEPPEASQPEDLPVAPLPPIHPRPVRGNFVLPILVPYAVFMTIMAINYYVKYANVIQLSPLEQIPDLLGEFQQKQTKGGSHAVRLPPPEQPLPDKLITTLGRPLRIGDIEVTPLSVEYRSWSGFTKQKNRSVPTTTKIAPTLILHVLLKNVSADLTFYPTDPYFDRNPKSPNDKPYTLVDVGGRKYYGGLIEYLTEAGNTERTWLQGQDDDNKPLAPGESRETVMLSRPSDRLYDAVRKAAAPAVWRVQVRRGMAPYQATEVPVSTVVGVSFTADDIKKAG